MPFIDNLCIDTIVQNIDEVKSVQELFNIIIDVMEFYDKYEYLSGQDKLDKVKKMLLLVLLSHVKDEDQKRFYKDIVPMIVELVIEISKRKKLQINNNNKINKFNCGCFLNSC
jgi:hypothetical protein